MNGFQDNQNAQIKLDQFKLRLALAVLGQVDFLRLREKSLDNLARWKKQGVWCSAYDEWNVLMTSGSDAEVIAAMTGQDENANRLRQSPPYTGLLDQAKVERLRIPPNT